jgi:hypothetical protein
VEDSGEEEGEGGSEEEVRVRDRGRVSDRVRTKP